MKTLKSLVLTILLTLTAILGLASPATASNDCQVADCFNVLRNDAKKPSIASDAQLNALAQRAAQTGEPVALSQIPGANRMSILKGLGSSNTAAVDNYITKQNQVSLMMQDNWTAMGSGSSVRADGYVHTVSILVEYPRQAVAPAPAPAPPKVSNPQPAPQPIPEAPAPAPAAAPVEQAPVEPVAEPVVEPEAPKEEKPVEAPKDEKPAAEPTPTETATPEPTETAEAVVVNSNDDATPPAGLEFKEVVQKVSMPASGVLGLLSVLFLVLFLKHRKLSSNPADTGGLTATTA